MIRPGPKLRYCRERSFRPDVETCEREIIAAWNDLCRVEKTPMPESVREAERLRFDRNHALWMLNDFSIYRARALKREAVRP